MVYIRGNRRDYDDWGVPGWSWDDLFPYFLRAEDNERGASRVARGRRPAGGQRPALGQRDHPGLRRGRSRSGAGTQRGLQRRRAGRGRDVPGDPARRDARQHRRRLPAPGDGAAEPDGDALHAGQPGAVRRAPGRSASRPSRLGQAQELRAEREVILCGGAYNSPQLLMLSGVGPAEHLTMREVEVLLDQPAVGENLSDHAATYGVWTTPEPESLLLALEPAALEEFRRRRPARSPPTSPSRAASPGSAAAPRRRTSSSTSPRSRSSKRAWATPRRTGSGSPPASSPPRAAARSGSRSNDPTARPIVRNRFYSASRDMPRMVDALRLMEEICAQPAFRPYAPSRSRARRRLRGRAARPRRRARPFRSTTRSGPARSARSSTPTCASTASRASASSMPR